MKKIFAVMSLAVASLIVTDPLSAEGFYPGSCDCSLPFRGFYLGGNVGFGSYTSRTDDVSQFSFSSNFITTDTNWIAGVQGGYDLTCFCDSLILGFVADWDWSNAENKIFLQPNSTTIPSQLRIDTELNWFSTFRLRVGSVFCRSALLYFTGGAALGDFKSSFRVLFTPGFATNTFHQKRWGWTGGLGAEFALCGKWTLNTEVLYMHFQKKRVNYAAFTLGTVFPIQQVLNDEAWVGRIGLNYRFSWGR